MQKIKSFTRDKYITYYGSDENVLINDTYQLSKDKFRGVWVSTVENIDINPFVDKADGMAQIDDIVKTCHDYNLNAIVFQVRPTNDALYESNINPWASILNKDKIEDVNPGFDPLAYMIEKASKVGIEVHAWMNPYRVTNKDLSKLGLTKDEYLDKLSDKNFAKINRDLVIETSEHHLILDPASKVVQQYLVDTVLEIANKYDVKAFHIDDYFYPYDELNDPNEEEKRQIIAPYLPMADFRRFNVNEMIRKIHEALKTVNKKIEFGISPFGVYRTHSKYFKDGIGGWERGSDNFSGALQAYEKLYSDIYLWMKEGWIDYVVPQDYFLLDYYKEKEDGTQIDIVKYADLVKWWNGVAKETKTKLYIGMALYRVCDEGAWSNVDEIFNQLKLNQVYDHVEGFVMFTYHDLTRDDSKVKVEVQNRLKELWKK